MTESGNYITPYYNARRKLIQDGFKFNDLVEGLIAMAEDDPAIENLSQNVKTFIYKVIGRGKKGKLFKLRGLTRAQTNCTPADPSHCISMLHFLLGENEDVPNILTKEHIINLCTKSSFLAKKDSENRNLTAIFDCENDDFIALIILLQFCKMNQIMLTVYLLIPSIATVKKKKKSLTLSKQDFTSTELNINADLAKFVIIDNKDPNSNWDKLYDDKDGSYKSLQWLENEGVIKKYLEYSKDSLNMGGGMREWPIDYNNYVLNFAKVKPSFQAGVDQAFVNTTKVLFAASPFNLSPNEEGSLLYSNDANGGTKFGMVEMRHIPSEIDSKYGERNYEVLGATSVSVQLKLKTTHPPGLNDRKQIKEVFEAAFQGGGTIKNFKLTNRAVSFAVVSSPSLPEDKGEGAVSSRDLAAEVVSKLKDADFAGTLVEKTHNVTNVEVEEVGVEVRIPVVPTAAQVLGFNPLAWNGSLPGAGEYEKMTEFLVPSLGTNNANVVTGFRKCSDFLKLDVNGITFGVLHPFDKLVKKMARLDVGSKLPNLNSSVPIFDEEVCKFLEEITTFVDTVLTEYEDEFNIKKRKKIQPVLESLKLIIKESQKWNDVERIGAELDKQDEEARVAAATALQDAISIDLYSSNEEDILFEMEKAEKDALEEIENIKDLEEQLQASLKEAEAVAIKSDLRSDASDWRDHPALKSRVSQGIVSASSGGTRRRRKKRKTKRRKSRRGNKGKTRRGKKSKRRARRRKSKRKHG